ncbi:MAG: NusA-like transcription termination signal-binding factor [Candidatus Hodarchaeota archaeon]
MKLDERAIQYISYFENISGATVDDCISLEDRIIYIVKKGQVGLAIGKRGINIKRAIKDLKKEIEIIENGDNAEELIRNALHPAEINEITITTSNEGGDNVAYVKIDPKFRGMAIGKGGSKIDRCRILLERHFQISDVILTKG